MKILFITGHPYLPQMHGGLQASTDQLCQCFIERGYDVAVLSALIGQGFLGSVSRVKMFVNKQKCGQKIARDTGLGYPIWRTWYPWEAIHYVAAEEKPDLIVVLAVKPVRMALAALPTGIPVLMKLQDVEFSQHDGHFEDLGHIPCIANSQFTAETYHNAYGVDPAVIYPFITPNEYKTVTTGENVTFINPVEKKGLSIALGVAQRCPDIPFSFVESWPLSGNDRSALLKQLASLPNVTLSPAQDDMRAIYGKARLLLAPSMWEEGYGRVVTEAQFSGIPAITSDRGGLPEAVGPGGLVVDHDQSIDGWVNAVRALWTDERLYAEKSAAAFAFAHRPAMSLQHHIDAYETAFSAACERHEVKEEPHSRNHRHSAAA